MSAARAERPTAVYFGSPRTRFGWLHMPINPAGIALVIVPPFGYEAICAHRTMRHLAEDAAVAGILAIRVDLDGTGDSQGTDLDSNRVDAWLASISDACDLARQRGADRIVIAGIRLGATLACIAAERRDDIAGVVAIAAVANGKAYARELKMLQGALGLAPDPASTPSAPTDIDEAVGYAITTETKLSLAGLDLLKATKRPAPAIMVIDRDDLPANDKWIAKLRELHAEVEHARFPGYVEMLADPHKTCVPEQMLAAAIDFTSRRSLLPGTSPARDIAIRGDFTADGITESLTMIDRDLVAVVVKRTDTTPRSAVILLNSGAIHRVGPNRLYVALARRLAAAGHLVLRVDMSGIGDSRLRTSAAAENIVYSDQAVGDVSTFVEWAKRTGATKISVGGVCSGAYHALKAAVAGQPITTVFPINPLTFFWEPGMPLDIAAHKVTSEAARYAESARSAESWKKLLRGEVHVRRAAEIMVHRARDLAESRARDVLRRLRVPLANDLGTELLQLARTDIGIHFVFADEDPGRAMLEEQGGSAVGRLVSRGQLRITVIEGPDHTFTARWSHPIFLDAVERAATP